MATETSTAASAGRSGGGGASADSYIGSLITLTSKSEIRYEGVLLNINTEESSIGLRNVRSFGTEGRKKDGPQLPPSDRIYEYILFRGTDIKDLQVKASPPVQTTPPINSDPAIIQSHYPHPTTPHTGLATAPIGSFADIGSPSAQMGIPGPTFQSGPPLYQPGGNMNSWVPSPSNATGNVLPMPMYWQGYYNPPNGLPQAPQPPQQSFPRPPIGLSIPPSMQQMQLSALNSSLPTSASSLPGSILPDHHSSFLHNNTSSSNLVSASLPASTLSLNVPPLQPVSLASEVMTNLLPNKAPLSTIPTSTPSSGLPSLPPFSVHDNVGTTSFNGKSIIPGPAALPQQNIIQPVTSAVETSGSDLTETPIPSLITPGHLLHCGPSAASTLQPLQITQKDVEVVQVSPKLSDPSASTVTEAQPPILPLPPNARAHKSNGGSYHMHNNYRGRGGRRGSGNQRPLMKFTEDFDFMAMNEKFNKDEVWGHLGKSNRSQSKDKEVNFSGSDEDEQEYEDDVELPKIEIQPVYNKDDFFDSLSCNALDNDPNRGRPKYSEQMKLDTETFGEFSRFRGGRGGRGFGRVGGRFHGHSYGRGNGGYGYPSRGRGWSRGRGQSMQSRAS